HACVDSVFKTIVVRNVKADFTIDESKSPVYQFTNKSLMSVSYKWFVGTDLTDMFSQDVNPSKTYTDTGAITICLQAFSSFGCWDTTCKQISAKHFVRIPNVFTPGNNDGINDAFDIDIAGFTKYQLVIYNRWGTKVFETDKDGNGNDGINWNGKEFNTGARCAEGTYFFIFNYKMVTEPNEKTVHGSVTLLREEK
ncbi:MAG: gliding motility-associated C-terminal domain-containing protein, partial [Bacteroidia bacterium]